ncbi:MAG: MBL fold metallo-hydrolase [Chloroflexota bacterium]
MQDGGLPHAGCRCPRCAATFANPPFSQYVASLALVDGRQNPPAVWLIDATPDLKYQLHLLADALGPHPTRPGRLRQPDGVFLTHAHLGHVAGLAQFGPEAMHAQQLPVYGSPGLVAVIKETALWRPLLVNLELMALAPDQPFELSADLTLTPIPVPHRDEWAAGTVAYRIQGPARSLLYLPDIDSWQEWSAARQVLASVDYALVDATFYSSDELGGRAPVAHPLVPDTLALWADLPSQLVLTHLNHTNPLLDKSSAERAVVRAAGAQVAYSGQVFTI